MRSRPHLRRAVLVLALLACAALPVVVAAALAPESPFVGPSTGLTGPAGVVEVLENHDDHLHLRLPPERG